MRPTRRNRLDNPATRIAMRPAISSSLDRLADLGEFHFDQDGDLSKNSNEARVQ